MEAIRTFARRKRTFFATLLPILMWWFGNPTPRGFAVGMGLVIVGQALRIWSAGVISKDRVVATGGPYAYVRNPLYLGSWIISVGFATMAAEWWAYGIVVVQFLFFYYLAILSEERFLDEKLGEPYREYRATVPRFWPTRGCLRGAEKNSFRWQQVSYNREYRSFVPVALLCLLFALKVWWPHVGFFGRAS